MTTQTRDPTFSKFTAKEGKAYSASRGIKYPSKVFDTILEYHSGQTQLAVDTGCGPGNVTQSLATYFDRVIGLDNSEGMIEAANGVLPDELRSKVSFGVCPAEKLSDYSELKTGSVDLITSAVAVSIGEHDYQ